MKNVVIDWYNVLILVVVEDVLVQIKIMSQITVGRVLILVVVEDVLVHVQLNAEERTIPVLILVVVEDVLVLNETIVEGKKYAVS